MAVAGKWSYPPVIWKHTNPSFSRAETFRRWINHKHGLHLKDYDDLHGYSVTDWTFWKDLWDFLGIIYSDPPTKVIINAPIEQTPEWFPGARLNYAENILNRNDDSICCTGVREHGPKIHYSSRQLREMVRKMASAMRANGLRKGDRVAAIATNSIDALVIMLATVSIGAIYSSTATDMGVSGILDRYRQIKPKLVFSETEVIYAGKNVDVLSKAAEVTKHLASNGLEILILLPSTITGQYGSKSVKQSVTLSTFLNTGDDCPLVFEQVSFMHPVFILYSSGTSGPPKCIVHTGGGVLMNTMKDYTFAMDLHKDDTYFQYTTCAWMMWNAMIATLAIGARLILYDGSPFHPDVKRFLKIIDDERVTHIGTSPRFLSEVQGRGIIIKDLARFESLRAVFVTGAVLTAPSYIWASQSFPSHAQVFSGSGGTDVCTAFVGGCPGQLGFAGEMQVKCLGMKVEIFDEGGKNIEDTGEPGELVCTRAQPSLPLGFWGDDKRTKYHDAYYAKYPGVWTQGDFIVKNPLTKGFYVLGRSDGVLNPSGVRFGSGEIYSALEKFKDMIDDTLCIGQHRKQDKDERVLLFVKMREGKKVTESFRNEIRKAIRTALSSRHVPAYIFEVSEIPYTVNGKKIEIAVKQIVSGSTMKPSGTVANPESLEQYYKYQKLESIIEDAKAKL